MKSKYRVPPFDVHVTHKPDVCIVGGGAAGLAAAIGASRCGLKTLLVEKYGFCGGATVAGLSGTICGLYSSGDKPEQIVFGFADEFHGLLKQLGGVKLPVPFGRTCLIPHDSFIWKQAADYLLGESGCEILYHTQFVNAFVNESGEIHTLLLQGAEGLFAVQPKIVIDASGDAAVVHSVHGKTFMGKNGLVQTPTMIFRLGGVAMKDFLAIDPREIVSLVTEASESGQYALPRHHVYIFPMPNGHEVLCNMTKITYPNGSIPTGLSSKDLTYAEIEGRRQVQEYTRFLKEKIPAFRNAYIVETGTQVGIRQTRSIVGTKCLMNEDVLSAKKVKAPVTFSAWPIEAHGSGELKIVYLENDSYDIPFETLIPAECSNLLVAGRCMSAEHEALASARVTAQCFGMGYAAGAAASLVKQEKLAAQSLTGEWVSDWMKEHKLKRSHEH